MDQLTTGFLLFSYQFIAGSEMDVHPFIWIGPIAFDHVWPIKNMQTWLTYKRHGFCHSLMSTGNEYRAVK